MNFTCRICVSILGVMLDDVSDGILNSMLNVALDCAFDGMLFGITEGADDVNVIIA